MALSSFTTPKKAENQPIEPSLTGVITDAQTGETLAGVEVSIEGTNLKTYTNFDGEFSFKNIKPGDYKIATKYVSYEGSNLKTVTVKNNEVHSLTVLLKPQTNEAPVLSVAKVESNNEISEATQLATK